MSSCCFAGVYRCPACAFHLWTMYAAHPPSSSNTVIAAMTWMMPEPVFDRVLAVVVCAADFAASDVCVPDCVEGLVEVPLPLSAVLDESSVIGQLAGS